jgi:hypothetical protein
MDDRALELGGTPHGLLPGLAAALLIPLATIAIHELGHVLAARAAGLRPGFARQFWRSVRSRKPTAWAPYAARTISRRQALTIVLAGPAAQALWGLAMLALAPLYSSGGADRFGWRLQGFVVMVLAASRLASRRRPGGDGDQLRRVLAGRPASADPRAAMSFGPPGYGAKNSARSAATSSGSSSARKCVAPSTTRPVMPGARARQSSSGSA